MPKPKQFSPLALKENRPDIFEKMMSILEAEDIQYFKMLTPGSDFMNLHESLNKEFPGSKPLLNLDNMPKQVQDILEQASQEAIEKMQKQQELDNEV